MSRFLELRLRRWFGIDASVVTKVFDGNGQAKLWLPDDLATVTGLIVKVDTDGDYSFSDETALTIDTDFWVGPYNAALEPEPKPYEWLEVHPNSSVLSAWPEQQKSVQITAKWGWPAVPEAIKDATIMITRQLRDAEESGYTLSLESIDQAIPQGREVMTLLSRIERAYGKPPGVF